MKKIKLIFMLFQIVVLTYSQILNLPPRIDSAMTGSEFAQLVWNFSRVDREDEIYAQVMSGNIPEFQRNLIPITFSQTINSTAYNVTYYVLPDYLAIGCDTNYFLIPMTPILAQKICNKIGYTMTTRKMVDQIWSNATVKLAPSPIPPSDTMTTVPVFWQHNVTVWGQREAVIGSHPLGELVGGDKKDVVISNKIYGNPPPDRVVIYGWHYTNGTPIQPLYSGHEATYADYSHGIRLVQDSITINGQPNKITTILQNDSLYTLFSDEGRIAIPYYPLSSVTTPAPSAWGVISNDTSSLRLIVNNNPDVTHFLVHLSADGINFTSSILVDKTSPILNGLQKDSTYYIRIQAIGVDTSTFTEVLAGVPSDTGRKVLIVNGFDRSYTGNTYNFIRMHAAAVKNYGYNFDSSTNEAIMYELINLNDYKIADYILGVESTINETFSSTEQSKVSSFLNNGGALFVSGAEIAWDLDYMGSTTDKNFFYNYLKAEYINDAPNGQSKTYYTAEGIAGNIFDGITNITYDNGTHGTYNVEWPDVINGKNGGSNALKYTGVTTNNGAGVVHKGFFPNGTTNGAVVYFGFPFETIYPESKRFEVMNKVLEYFEILNDISNEFNKFPNEYKLYQNYPNPFNPSTNIKYSLPEAGNVKLSIYNVLGQEVETLVNEYKEAGNHSVSWGANNFSSGVYIYKLEVNSKVMLNKMILLK